MLPIITVVLILIPFIEVAVLFLVADAIGWPIALALFILVPVVGLLVLRQQGLTAMRRTQTAIRQERLPAPNVVDAMLLGAAGVLLVVPGFVTASLGLLLLIPPLRHTVARAIIGGLRRRLERTPPVAVSVSGSGGVTTEAWAEVVTPEALPPAAGAPDASARWSEPSGDTSPDPDTPSSQPEVPDAEYPPVDQIGEPLDHLAAPLDPSAIESGVGPDWHGESEQREPDADAWVEFERDREWVDEPRRFGRILGRRRRTE